MTRAVGGETGRAPDGLALSSRNGYLDAAQRAEAVQLSAALRRIEAATSTGERDWTKLEVEAMNTLIARGWAPDYVAIRRRRDLGAPGEGEPLVVLAAAKQRRLAKPVWRRGSRRRCSRRRAGEGGAIDSTRRLPCRSAAFAGLARRIDRAGSAGHLHGTRRIRRPELSTLRADP